MSVDIIEEAKQRLEAQIAQTKLIATGRQILFTFYRNHPEFEVCQGSDSVIEGWLRDQGKIGGFSLQDLENGVSVFGPSMARSAPRIPVPYVPPVQEPKPPAPLVPYTRKQLLHLDPETLKKLYQQSPEHLVEVNRILNQGRQ
jgi:hypothetical protein